MLGGLLFDNYFIEFISQAFEDFACHHKDIRVLQFNTCVCPVVSEARLTRGFNHFRKLQKFSLSPVLLLGIFLFYYLQRKKKNIEHDEY